MQDVHKEDVITREQLNAAIGNVLSGLAKALHEEGEISRKAYWFICREAASFEAAGGKLHVMDEGISEDVRCVSL